MRYNFGSTNSIKIIHSIFLFFLINVEYSNHKVFLGYGVTGLDKQKISA